MEWFMVDLNSIMPTVKDWCYFIGVIFWDEKIQFFIIPTVQYATLYDIMGQVSVVRWK